ncbi:MAG TPA: M48 family metalloprotease [Myxococcota bacterium]|nr:M48 family metalloprotease [Myxococcota bacterium]
MSRIRASLLLALVLALGACITRSGEQQLGDEEAKKVAAEMGLLRDPKLQSYVEALGAKLAAVSETPEGPWQFEIVDKTEPNAFALPGGHVYVTRGLLALVNSEDELAGVMGHEIAHVTARHTSKRIGAAVLTAPVNIATGLAGFAVGIVSPVLGSAVAGTGEALTGGLVLAPFSREQEHEADEIGQGIAAKAGYDPAGLPRFLRTLDRDVALLPGEKREFHFLDSHPLTPDRVARTEERAKQLERAPATPIAGGRDAFLARLDGLVVGEDPAQGVFVERRFLHPELRLAIDFPAGWKTENTNEAVGAVSPAKDAVVALRMAKQNSSLDDVIKEVVEKQSDLRFERFAVNGLSAARTSLPARDKATEITLIEYARNVYAVVGQSGSSVASKYAPAFRATASSFHALGDKERRSISESRLRVRSARPNETPTDIATRTRSTWNGERVAVANEVAPGDRFAAGWAVKLALPQAYTPR